MEAGTARAPAPPTAAQATPLATPQATTQGPAPATAPATALATPQVTAPAAMAAAPATVLRTPPVATAPVIPVHQAMAAPRAILVRAIPLGHHTDPLRAVTGVPQHIPPTAVGAVDVRDGRRTGGERARGGNREGPSRVGIVLPKDSGLQGGGGAAPATTTLGLVVVCLTSCRAAGLVRSDFLAFFSFFHLFFCFFRVFHFS